VAEKVNGVEYPRQVDCVVTVDPATGAVYVSFLAYGLDDGTNVAVARSTDDGATFTAVKVNGPKCFNCDHPWTIAYAGNVYTAYAHGSQHFLSRSSDGGVNWTESVVLNADHVAFPEGAVMDADHNPYFAWGDCITPNCKGAEAGDYRVSKTTAGTSTTKFFEVATAPAGPVCPYVPNCGFAFFGIQDDIAIDADGTLYVVWQDGQNHKKAGSPPIVQLSASYNGGKTWKHIGRADDKNASGCLDSSCYALFPRIEGGAPGQISVEWMDDRLASDLAHRRDQLDGTEQARVHVRQEPSAVGAERIPLPLRRLPGDRPDRHAVGHTGRDDLGRGDQLRRRSIQPGQHHVPVDGNLSTFAHGFTRRAAGPFTQAMSR
jgi:hypothetical protein